MAGAAPDAALAAADALATGDTLAVADALAGTVESEGPAARGPGDAAGAHAVATAMAAIHARLVLSMRRKYPAPAAIAKGAGSPRRSCGPPGRPA
jgi:hypothetical protein